MTINTRGAEWDAAAGEFGAEIDRLTDRIAELQAILAPLLARPIRPGEPAGFACLFCGTPDTEEHGERHATGCAVLRRDALLGR